MLALSVQVGERILLVDGRPCAGLSPSELFRRLSGPRGTATVLLLRTAGGQEKMLTLRREALAPRDPLRLLDAAGAAGAPIRAAILAGMADRESGGLERALQWAVARDEGALAGAVAGLLALSLDYESAAAGRTGAAEAAGAAAVRWYEWIAEQCGGGVDTRQEVRGA